MSTESMTVVTSNLLLVYLYLNLILQIVKRSLILLAKLHGI